MFDRLQAVEDRYERLNELLSDPDVVSDSNKLREYPAVIRSETTNVNFAFIQ